MTPSLQLALEKLELLSPERQNTIANRILADIEVDNSQPPLASPRKRVAGRFAGQVWMSEDFTAELPDEFWGWD